MRHDWRDERIGIVLVLVLVVWTTLAVVAVRDGGLVGKPAQPRQPTSLIRRS